MKSYTEIYEFVKGRLKESRFVHSIGVADTAAYLARRFALDEVAARICGIYHDAYRYDADDTTVAFLEANGIKLFDEEKENIVLLHGPLAAFHMRADVGEDTPDEFIKAVRHHTLGSKNMGRLGATIYIADYLEPGRKHLNDDDRSYLLEPDSLEEIIIRIMDMQNDYFKREGIKSARVSNELYDYIKSGGIL